MILGLDSLSVLPLSALPDAGGGSNYTLVAGVGSFTLTGVATGLKVDRKLTAETASYTLTGNNAGLSKTGSYALLAETASFALTGIDAELTYTPSSQPTQPPTPPRTGSSGFIYPWQIIEEAERKKRKESSQLEERRAELELVEQEIAEAETKAQAQAAERRNKRVARAQQRELARLQDEISALRMERGRLMRLIDDEEAILALLMAMTPFH